MNDTGRQIINLIREAQEKRSEHVEKAKYHQDRAKEFDIEISDLNKAYWHITGESYINFSDTPTIAELVEDILENSDPLYIDEIVRRVKEKHQIILKRQSVVATLIRYIQRDKTFERVGDNVFTLRKYVEYPTDEINRERNL